MILSSHRGLYRFWHKHYQKGRWYLDPFAYAGLMSLAYMRYLCLLPQIKCSRKHEVFFWRPKN